MTESEWADWQAGHHAARRDAGAVTLNFLTGDCEASLDLLLPRTTDEHIAIIAALASDLAVALGKIHGSSGAAITHLRHQLRYFAERG